MSLLRSARRRLLVISCCVLSACGTFKTYPGATLPDREVATVRCYFRFYLVAETHCRFTAVDGLRTGLSQIETETTKILPGSHWIEMEFERAAAGGAGGDICALDLDVQPGYVYQIKAGSLHKNIKWYEKPRGLFAGSVDVRAIPPSGTAEDRQIAVTCGGGSMCRKDEDCVPHPDIRCVPQEGFPFGECRFKN